MGKGDPVVLILGLVEKKGRGEKKYHFQALFFCGGQVGIFLGGKKKGGGKGKLGAK